MKKIPFSRLLAALPLIFLLFHFSMAQSITWSNCFVEDCTALKNPESIDFGYLQIPEDHALPNGPQFKLAFAVLRAEVATPLPDPVLYLSGGPGTSALLGITQWEDHFLRKDRDIILVDFRGIGYSEPRLCPELNANMWSLFAGNYVDPDREKASKKGWYEDCFTRLQASGIGLSQFRSAAVVKDLEILRQQLGYEQWNLLGISYGTRTAQTYMRDAPGHLRAVILDSVFPTANRNRHPLQGYLRSLTLFFDLCENDPECKGDLPELLPWFYETMNSLRTAPITLKDPAYPDGQFHINFQDAHLMFFQFLKNRDHYPALPYLIKAIETRNLEAFHNMMSLAKGQNRRVSMATGILVNKNDNYIPPVKPWVSEKDPLKDALTHFDGEDDLLRSMDFIPFDSLERQPVSSSIHTLILAGELDPATPPEYGEWVHEDLEHSQFISFPGVGHGVSRAGGCIPELLRQFLQSPAAPIALSCSDQFAVDPIPFTAKLYENAKVGTLIRQAALERRWYWLTAMALSFISWIISLLQWWQNKTPLPAPLKHYQWSHRLTSSLGIMLLLGTAWLIYQTSIRSQLLVLMGLVGGARYLYYLSYLFLAGMVMTLYLGGKGWSYQAGVRGKVLAVVSVLGLVGLGGVLVYFGFVLK